MPLPYRHLTSALLRREGQLFLFDCGEGTQVSLRRLNLRWKKIDAIFISHTHADHITGLPGLLMLSSQVERSSPLYVFGPPNIAEYVEMSQKTLDMYINYPIVVKEIIEPGIVYSSEEFYIRAFPLYHTKPCLGYTLEEFNRPGIFNVDKAVELEVPKGPLWGRLQRGESVTLTSGKVVNPCDVMGEERSGRKFSYVTDTLYNRAISEEVAGSDLLICEAMFENKLVEDAREKKHMTAGQAARIAKESGSKSMYMIHYSPRYADKELSILQEEARQVFPSSFLSRDRLTLDIPYID